MGAERSHQWGIIICATASSPASSLMGIMRRSYMALALP
jgi:hypothetical protein